MKFTHLFACVLLAADSFGQLIPTGSPVPRTAKPPVIFINGFQNVCPGPSFSGTFGISDRVLQANGEASLFFDICSVPGNPSIEDLGAAFGSFLSALRFADGQPVDTVDIVAHSMGGLVLRSYLTGKQNGSGVFHPPPVTHVRKAVFLATPHFGTGIGLLFGFSTQLQELASGSRFLFDLATWNQGSDDLRGIDAVTAIGNAGTGRTTVPGFDDGVVALTSGSLRFYLPGRTRVLPFCHVNGGGLVSFAGLCPSDALGIANIQSATDDPARLIVSFLNGTDDWKKIGVAAEDDRFLSANGGLYVASRTADDSALMPSSVIATNRTDSKPLNIPSQDVAYTDLFSAGPLTLGVSSSSGNIMESTTLAAGGTEAYIVKPGPRIARILPAASSVFPLSLAPGMFIAIYGASLAAATAQAPGLPFPYQLSDTQVLVNSAPIQLYYVSSAQIDAVLPDGLNGLTTLTVRNTSGSHTVNIWIEPAVPAIFTQDASGTGPAAALKANGLSLVTANNPLHAGDFVALYVTGLGKLQPTVTIGGKDCAVTFAGLAPGYVGLDQINCMVPSGLGANPSAPVVVTAGIRSSNTATLAVQ